MFHYESLLQVAGKQSWILPIFQVGLHRISTKEWEPWLTHSLVIEWVLIYTYWSLALKAINLSKESCFKESFSSRCDLSSIRSRLWSRWQAIRTVNYLLMFFILSHLALFIQLHVSEKWKATEICLCTWKTRSRPSLIYSNLVPPHSELRTHGQDVQGQLNEATPCASSKKYHCS